MALYTRRPGDFLSRDEITYRNSFLQYISFFLRRVFNDLKDGFSRSILKKWRKIRKSAGKSVELPSSGVKYEERKEQWTMEDTEKMQIKSRIILIQSDFSRAFLLDIVCRNRREYLFGRIII